MKNYVSMRRSLNRVNIKKKVRNYKLQWCITIFSNQLNKINTNNQLIDDVLDTGKSQSIY